VVSDIFDDLTLPVREPLRGGGGGEKAEERRTKETMSHSMRCI